MEIKKTNEEIDMIKKETVGQNGKDIRGVVDVFLITNGRSTSKYAIRAIREQSGVIFDFYIISDMDWVKANNLILETCKSNHYIRVDDDMILNSKAILYMFDNISPDAIITTFRLYDALREKILPGVKCYRMKETKVIGFETSVPYEMKKYGYVKGKIDVMFRRNATEKYGLSSTSKLKFIVMLNCVIGVHGFFTMEEQLEYRKLRVKGEWDKNLMGEYEEVSKLAKNFDISVEEQFNWATGNKLIEINRDNEFDFYSYIRR